MHISNSFKLFSVTYCIKYLLGQELWFSVSNGVRVETELALVSCWNWFVSLACFETYDWLPNIGVG